MKTIDAIQGADVVSDSSGRQYHINLAPGELSEYIILVGEAKRAERASKLLTDIRVTQHNREYLTYTGKYQGLEVSVMSTGMGVGATEIAMIEIFETTKNPTIVRIGTTGSLQNHIPLGSLVISSGAVRLEAASTYFVHEGYPAIANHEVILALIAASEREGIRYDVGITATGAGFYGAQGRKIPGIHIRNPNIPDEMAKMNVANMEMEASTIFSLAAMKGCRAGAACLAIAHRPTGQFIDPEGKKQGEANALKVGFDSLVILSKMDQIKNAKKKAQWYPAEL